MKFGPALSGILALASFGLGLVGSDQPGVGAAEPLMAEVQTVTNTFGGSGGLVVTKVVEGPPPPDGTVFGVEVDCSVAGSPVPGFDPLGVDLGFPDSLTVTVGPLPVGAECSVTETEDRGAAVVQITPPQPVTIGPDLVEVTVTNTFGGSQDSDEDGVTDDEDECPGFDDSIDADADGIPDGCDVLIDSDADGVPDSDDVCPDTVLPDEPLRGLGFFRFAAQANGSFDAGWNRLNGRYTIAGTGGCSGAQIIGELGLGAVHKRHGVSWAALKYWIRTLP